MPSMVKTAILAKLYLSESLAMAKNEEHLKHRGRFQAQGGGVEESESWAQKNPLSVRKALGLIGRLIDKLSKKDYERRAIQVMKRI